MYPVCSIKIRIRIKIMFPSEIVTHRCEITVLVARCYAAKNCLYCDVRLARNHAVMCIGK